MFFLAGLSISERQYELAEAQLRQVLRLDPDNALALNNLAWVLSVQKKPQALETAERANQLAPNQPLYKFNPLANMSSAEVWGYIRMLEIPYNPLHEQGFISIGCEPCTRPVLPNQHEREGRWWWEEATHKECGLHAGNLIAKD